MKNTKKTLATLTFALLFLVSFTNCGDKKGEQGGDDKPKYEEIEEPSTIIPLGIAKEQYDNYGKHRVPLIQQYEDSGRESYSNDRIKQQKMKAQGAEVAKDTFDVARYGYYDLDTLKNYIKYIEQEAARANVEIANVRFYFSNYPDKEEVDGKKIVHPKQNSFFLIPTIEQGDRDYAFLIRGEGEKWRPVLLTDQLEEIADQKGMGAFYNQNGKIHASLLPEMPTLSLTAFQGGDKSLISNEVDMVPPPYR